MKGKVYRVEARESEDGLAAAQFGFDTPKPAWQSSIF
jgi:hypothetical protein